MQDLSSQEQKIFDLLVSGASPKEIGYKLNISFHTVKYHQKNLYQKLGVNSINGLLTKYHPGNGEATGLRPAAAPLQGSPQAEPAVKDSAKRKPAFLKILVPVLTALGFFLIFHYSQKSMNNAAASGSDEAAAITAAMNAVNTAELPFPADISLTLVHDWEDGAAFYFSPDVFEYEERQYASPFKLGKGNRLIQGEIYQVTLSLTANVDMRNIEIAFRSAGAEDTQYWFDLSGYASLGRNLKAGTRYDFTTKILVTRTADSDFPAENLLSFCIFGLAEVPRTVTFHEFEVRKLSSGEALPKLRQTADPLPSPLVISFQNQDHDSLADNYYWDYRLNPNEFLHEGGTIPSPFKLGAGNRITEDDLYQISCTFTSNVDMNDLFAYFVDNTIPAEGFWTRLSADLNLLYDIKAGTEYSINALLLATKTASGSSLHANRFIMNTRTLSDEQPTLTFTRFEVVKIN